MRPCVRVRAGLRMCAHVYANVNSVLDEKWFEEQKVTLDDIMEVVSWHDGGKIRFQTETR